VSRFECRVDRCRLRNFGAEILFALGALGRLRSGLIRSFLRSPLAKIGIASVLSSRSRGCGPANLALRFHSGLARMRRARTAIIIAGARRRQPRSKTARELSVRRSTRPCFPSGCYCRYRTQNREQPPPCRCPHRLQSRFHSSHLRALRCRRRGRVRRAKYAVYGYAHAISCRAVGPTLAIARSFRRGAKAGVKLIQNKNNLD
jgi:hypothetical protein